MNYIQHGLLIGLGLAAIPVMAQSTDETEQQPVIDDIVVTATRTGQPATAVAGAVTMVDKETLSQHSAISDDLASVLARTVPGYAPSSQKLAGRGETLRGRNPLYLIDGVPQHNALRDGQRDGHTLDTAFIERIEVINGSNAIQGVGATGGVVNTVTRAPAQHAGWHTELKARLTAADELEADSLGHKVSVLTGRGGESFDFIAGAAFHERGLYLDSNGDAVGMYPTQGDIMDSASLNLFSKATWRPDERSSLTLMLNNFDLQRNGDFRSVPGDRAAGLPTGTIHGDPSAEVGDPARNRTNTLSLTYRAEQILGGSLEAQLYDQSSRALFEGGTFNGFFRLTPDGEPFLDQSEIVSDKNGLKLTYNYLFANPGVTATGGLDLFRDSSAQVLARSGRQWVPETRFSTVSPFLQLGWDIAKALTVSAGARHEKATLEVADYTTIASANNAFVSGGSPGFSQNLLNAGVIYRITDSWSVYGASSEGFTMPDVGRVLRAVSTPGQDVDSLIAIEPIVADNTEIGIEFDNGPVVARVTYFESDADNGSRLYSNPEGIFEVQRQRTEIGGYEATIDFHLGTDLTVGANYSRTNGRFDSNDDNQVDSDLDGLNVGPDRLNLYAYGVFADSLTWWVLLSDFQDRNFAGPAAPVDRNFDGYRQLDLYLGWQTGVGLFSLAAENLLNEDYFTYFAQTEPAARQDTYFKGNGRTITLGWSRNF